VPFLPLDAPSGQLVVTVGPASFDLGGALARAGATAFRLNASHMSPGELAGAAAALRSAAPDCPLVFDLQGAKMRLGAFPPRPLRAGERVVFRSEVPSGAAAAPGTAPVVLPHTELFRSVHPGETLSLDDDRLRLRVLEVGPGTLTAEARRDGTLLPRKGVNVLEHPIELDDLSPADRAHLSAVANLQRTAFAFSFMATGAEAQWLRRRGVAAVIGKVERVEACRCLAPLARSVEVVWICRGDLGAQLGSAGLARFVARLLPRDLPVPVLMAGQVLQNLTHQATPTRSEVCHLFDLLERGYAGLVLSDETAVGSDPVGATAAAAELLAELGRPIR
jgi:pyruvate kinase